MENALCSKKKISRIRILLENEWLSCYFTSRVKFHSEKFGEYVHGEKKCVIYKVFYMYREREAPTEWEKKTVDLTKIRIYGFNYILCLLQHKNYNNNKR